MQKRRKGARLDRKLEKDQVVTKSAVESYSLDDKEDAKAIQEVISGRQSVKKILSANQEDLVEAKTKPRVNWDKLEALGPVKVGVRGARARPRCRALGLRRLYANAGSIHQGG